MVSSTCPRRSIRGAAVLLILVFTLPALAGCLGSEDAGPSGTAELEAEEEETGEPAPDLGVLHGFVHDDLFNPLEGATVALYDGASPEPVDETRTDAEGAYRFTDLAPRGYQLAANHTGHEPTMRPATVKAGEETKIVLTLVVVPSGKPYTVPIDFVGFVGCDHGYYSYLVELPVCPDEIQSPNHNPTTTVDIPADTQTILMEARYTPTYPAMNRLTFIPTLWERTPSGDEQVAQLSLFSGTDARANFTREHLQNAGATDGDHYLQLTARATRSPAWVHVPNIVREQPFEVYFTIFAVDPMDDPDFTRIPEE